MTLRWDPSSDTGITSYTVEQSTDGGTNWTQSTFSNLTKTAVDATIDVTGLTNGSTYHLRIAAVTGPGDGSSLQSRPSDSVQAVPVTADTVDTVDTVAQVDLTPSNGRIDVSWTAPTGVVVVSYDVEYCDTSADCSDDTNWTDAGHTGTSTTITITGLTNGNSYSVRVRARTSSGPTAWCVVAETVVADPPGAPGKPSLTAGNAQIVSVWTAPSSNGGSNITGYEVQYCPTPRRLSRRREYDRSVNENTTAGENAGDAVTATDPDADATLTYTLGGTTDDQAFDIDGASGQLKTKAALDFETDASYGVTVSVSDSEDAAGDADTVIDATITVTISVTDVNDAPVIAGPEEVTFEVSENEAVTTLVGTVTATDQDVGAAITWSHTGERTLACSISAAAPTALRVR